MLTVARMDRKDPNQGFQSDRAGKKRIASETPAIRKVASELSGLHAEACRDRQGSDETNRHS